MRTIYAEPVFGDSWATEVVNSDKMEAEILFERLKVRKALDRSRPTFNSYCMALGIMQPFLGVEEVQQLLKMKLFLSAKNGSRLLDKKCFLRLLGNNAIDRELKAMGINFSQEWQRLKDRL